MTTTLGYVKKHGINGVETRTLLPGERVYPDSDGEPMAGNTERLKWITMLKDGHDAMYRDRDDVFVAGDLLWYPVQGRPEIRLAPDVMIAIGRPKGYRGSYKQWEEANVAPQVVWEIQSPGNTIKDLTERKLFFYERHGVQEYYIYDPDSEKRVFRAWRRASGTSPLQEISTEDTIQSKVTGVRMNSQHGDLIVLRPDGEPFKTFVQLMLDRDDERRRAEQAEAQLEQAEEALSAERLRGEEAALRIARLEERLRRAGLSMNGTENEDK